MPTCSAVEAIQKERRIRVDRVSKSGLQQRKKTVETQRFDRFVAKADLHLLGEESWILSCSGRKLRLLNRQIMRRFENFFQTRKEGVQERVEIHRRRRDPVNYVCLSHGHIHTSHFEVLCYFEGIVFVLLIVYGSCCFAVSK